MEQQIVVKTEMGANGEILLFYVDENEEGVLTAVENIDGQAIQLQQDNQVEYILGEAMDIEDALEQANVEPESIQSDSENWLEDEIKRLLMFYNDNKQTFLQGTTKKTHLWSVACKTMLFGKTADSCETQFQNLKMRYIQIRGHMQRGIYIKWPVFEQCHKAFQDDESIKLLYTEDSETDQLIKIPATPKMVPVAPQVENNGIMVVKKVNNRTTSSDEKVVMMLSLYLKHKKEGDYQKQYRRRDLWEIIALEMGEDDSEYWHKRFLNFKQHYIHILDKRKECGDETASTWPYTALFDKIFEDDEEFQRKYTSSQQSQVVVERVNTNVNFWNDTELTVLVKYCFDCFDEFQDTTIPNSFLWNEIGRLLDKPPEKCKEKYEELKNAHLDGNTEGGYVLRTRKPLAILFDNIISKEVEQQLLSKKKSEQFIQWKTEELDELVQFLYENIEMYKDPVCYFVCWAKIGKKLHRNVNICRRKWEELKKLYKSILNDKKENPDMEIEWRYIELFDRIFDYGMDTTLLSGYDNIQNQSQSVKQDKIGVKKVNIKIDSLPKAIEPMLSDNEELDDKGLVKRTKEYISSSKTVKILEFYHKNKEKFMSQTNKYALWSILAKQLGVTANQCMKKFKSIKQQYTSFVEKELNNELITWPYYALCKKVYGYRAIKSKLKSKKLEWESEDWTDAEIKKLIHYFANNFDEIDKNTDDVSKWSTLAEQIDKTEYACKEKFLELRKSYRKLRTRSRNPDVKISWKFFQLFDQVYSSKEDSNELMMEEHIDEVYDESDTKVASQEEDDYQCIIVLQEGQELSDITADQVIVQNGTIQDQIDSQNNIMVNEDQVIDVNNHIINEDQDVDQNNDVTHEDQVNDQNNSMPHMDQVVDENNLVMIHENQDVNHDNDIPCKDQVDENNHMMNQDQDVKQDQDNIINPQPEKAVSKTPTKWTKRTKKRLLILYINYLRSHKGKEINAREMWREISSKLQDKTPLSCRKMFAKLKANHTLIAPDDLNMKKTPYYTLLEKIQAIKPKFTKIKQNRVLHEGKSYKNVEMDASKVEQALQYYLQHIEDFASPKYEKKYLWTELANYVSEPVTKVFNKINYLKQCYDGENPSGIEISRFGELLQEITAKEIAIKLVIDTVVQNEDYNEIWTDKETEMLLEWYLSNLDKFKNPKFVRSYLWVEVSGILKKSPLDCSKKMGEIRTQYRNMVRENSEELSTWRFHDLCQKIYGTGKKGNPSN